MKLFIALTLLSFSALAVDPQSSWEEISNDWDLETHEARINFSGTFVSVFNVCHINETELRTKKPITIYEWVNDEDFEAVGKDYKTRSINYRRVTVDGESTGWEEAVYPLNYMVKVTTDTSEGMGRVLFSKAYSIPECK